MCLTCSHGPNDGKDRGAVLALGGAIFPHDLNFLTYCNIFDIKFVTFQLRITTAQLLNNFYLQT